MSHPIGTLLRSGGGDHHVTAPEGRVVQVDGTWKGTIRRTTVGMKVVHVPTNVVTTNTVPDWATDCPIGGLTTTTS